MKEIRFRAQKCKEIYDSSPLAVMAIVAIVQNDDLGSDCWTATIKVVVVGSSLHPSLCCKLSFADRITEYLDLARCDTPCTSCKRPSSTARMYTRSGSKNLGSQVMTSRRIMWKWWQLYCVLLHLCARSSCQRTVLDSPFNVMLFRALRNWSFNVVGRTGTEERYLQMAKDANKVQGVIPDNVPFPCNVTVGRSAEVPNSVHKLRPGDIDVIAAMGDSLTAGAGIFANNVFQIIMQNRGVTAAGGGQGTWKQYLTLPNIIKEFNPNLIGYALGDSLVSHEASQLNIAEIGAFSEDMPYMTEILVKRIKSDPRINLQKHWKLISIMIGSNNFCTDICWIPSPWSVLEKHKTDMLQVLRTLRDNLPRTFVALILPPHLRALVETRKGHPSFRCFITTDVECSCMFGSVFQKSIPLYYDIMRRWQELDIEIAASPEFQRNDFAVVAQPLLLDTSIPLASDGYSDLTYLSSDCFHISQKGNAWYANSLWNNLLEPVGTKATKVHDLFEKFYCPTPERPYLATMLNSRN